MTQHSDFISQQKLVRQISQAGITFKSGLMKFASVMFPPLQLFWCFYCLEWWRIALSSAKISLLVFFNNTSSCAFIFILFQGGFNKKILDLTITNKYCDDNGNKVCQSASNNTIVLSSAMPLTFLPWYCGYSSTNTVLWIQQNLGIVVLPWYFGHVPWKVNSWY